MLSTIFYKILYMSIIGTIISILVYIIIKIFDKRLSAKYKCIILMMPLIFFIVPFNRIHINTNIDISFLTNKIEDTVIGTTYIETDNNQSLLDEKYDVQISSKTQNNQNKLMDLRHIFIDIIIPIIWSGIVIIITILFFIGNIKLYKKIINNKRCRDKRIKDILLKCKKDLNINKRIKISINDLNESPCIYGFIKPQIILSEDFIQEDEITIENVFRHELSHYKRKDIIANYLLLLMSIIHWFNPFVYILFKKIRQEIELATDELALKYMNKQERKMYGMTLINLLQRYQVGKNMSKILCITDDEKNMEKRIKMIKYSDKKTHKIIIGGLAIVVVAFTTLPFIVEANNELVEKSHNKEQMIDNNVTNDINYEQNENDTNSYIEAETPSEEDVKQIKKKQEEVDKDTKENINVSVQETKEPVNLTGKYKLFKAKQDNKEIPLDKIYGTAILKYGGSLNIKPDGTYTEFIGVYSADNIGDLQGTYKIEDKNSILLITDNKEKKKLIYTKDDDGNSIIIENSSDGISLYFKK